MVPGAAFLDYDSDGDLDIYLLNCGAAVMPGVTRDPTRARNRLYRQENGRFVDATDESGLGDEGYGSGVAVGDVNNDGYPDVYVTNYGQNRLFLNHGGRHFTDVTQWAGVGDERWSTGVCFLDYDRDGRLDLYVSNYVDYFPARKCYGYSGRRDYCGPASFDKTADRLFHNVTPAGATNAEEVRFEDVTLEAGIALREGSGLGVVSCDFNDDGWPDIYVANDMVANFLWINQQDGTFRDEALTRGVAYDAMGRPQASMGIALSDLNDDQIPDLYVTHMTSELNVLYVSDGPIGYREMGVPYGVAESLHALTTFGAVLLDIDHSGLDDAIAVNGSMKLPDSAVDIPAHLTQQAYWEIFAETNEILMQRERGKFTVAHHQDELLTSRRETSRGICTGDMDNDGDLDLLLVNAAAPARLYRNVAKKQGAWLRIRAIEPQLGGRDAYGARVTVRAGQQRWTRWICPSGSYLCSHDPIAHFGLGAVEQVDQIHVRWPDGTEETFAAGPVNQLRVLQHGTSHMQAVP